MDQILIEALEIECIVGLRPLERRRRQRVRIDVTLGLDLSHAARTGRIGHTADYSRVANEIAFLLRFREYRLIEAATEELAAMLLGIHTMLDSIDIRLEKPEALHGRARAASVRISRRRADLPTSQRAFGFGELVTLLEAREAGLYLARVEPGCALPALASDNARSVEWLIDGQLDGREQRERTASHTVFPEGRRTAFENVGNDPATLFICRCPPLGDEISSWT
jgi:7,8-dihydroneopterin aldolase/epimerase/oxygenase